jgi:hypothetical protein
MSNQLENEVAKGNRAKSAMNEFVQPFLNDARKALFDNFKSLDISQTDAIMECKRLLKVIDKLEASITTHVETGQLASFQLSKESNK